MRLSATFLLVFWLTAVVGSACYAQATTPQTPAPNKKACEFITKKEAQTILDTPVVAGGDGISECRFEDPQSPNSKLSLGVWYGASPDPNAFAETQKKLTDSQPTCNRPGQLPCVIKEVPDFADAAIWIWRPIGGGTLHAFKAGTMRVEVTVSGVSENEAMENAKKLAARPLGGTAGTGYVYLGTPKSNAAVATAATPEASVPQAAASTGEMPALGRKACDFVTKAEAESILGTAVEPTRGGGDGLETPESWCRYSEIGYTDRPPKNKDLYVMLWTSRFPNPNHYILRLKHIGDVPQCKGCNFPKPTITQISDFADAAMWVWYPGDSGLFYAFKAGRVQFMVSISGLSENQALQHAKALAAKALGGAGGTDFVYVGSPKSSAALAAEAKLPPGGKTFSQAPYITESQFLNTLKEVSLTFETDPSLEKLLSASDQRSVLESALRAYGIAVRPNAPVALVATVVHHEDVFTKTTTQGGRTIGVLTWPLHDLRVSLKFFVRAGAWRNGKFHLVTAAPAYSWNANDLIEDNDLRKSLYGDDTKKEIKDAFVEEVAGALKSIASNTKGERAPWPVSSWTEKDKASADAEFARIIRQPAVEPRRLEGISSAPELSLDPETNHETCPPDNAAWQDLWKKSFQRVGWNESREHPGLRLNHYYYCYFNYGMHPTHYFWLLDTISLVEPNLVFELNGQLYRRPGELVSAMRGVHKLEADMDSPMGDYLPRSVTDFLVDLAFGGRAAPAIPVASAGDSGTSAPANIGTSTPGPIASATTPVTPAVTAPRFLEVSAFDPQWSGQDLVVRGTVTRVYVQPKGFPHWVTVYFKESPDARFVLCSPYPDLFETKFGSDLSGLIGRMVEVEGPVEGSMCQGKTASIRVLTSNQIRLVHEGH